MVARIMAMVLILSCAVFSNGVALEREDVEFKIFQFPRHMIPRIDGNTDDWDIVPATYIVGLDQFENVAKGKDTTKNPKDLDVKVRVGG